MGATVEVRFNLEVPEEATDEQIHEWLEFELGVTGSISVENPLSSTELMADDLDVDIN
jgi:hypothetical protein